MGLLWCLFFLFYGVLLVATQCPMAPPCRCESDSKNPGKRLINCQRNGFNTVPNITHSEEIFSELTLENNNITKIGPGSFEGIKVEKIDLLENALNQVDDNAFSGVEENLKTLYLEGNKVSSPPFTALQNLSGLTQLWLEFFNLPQITATTPFEYFPNLETLILMDMKVGFIASDSFQNKLEKIKRLQFVNNIGVSSFPVGAIRQLRTLTHLEWQHNNMIKIPSYAFRELTNLTELDLRGNMIKELEQNCFNGINLNLKYLGLHLNGFINETNVAEITNNSWPKLEQLNLGQNSFQRIPTGFFQSMQNLQYLGLPGNKLSQIGSSYFEGLSNIHSIDLAENEIRQIDPGSFVHMPLLDTLDLRTQHGLSLSNRLNLSTAHISGIENYIKTLYLQGTYLYEKEIWDAVGAMKNIGAIDLSNTGLTYIKDLVFSNHKYLKTLSVSQNNIVNVTQASFHGLNNSLTSLDLQNNLIKEIDECVFKTFSTLEYLYLGGNPLLCDCKLIWLYDWVQAIISNPNHPTKDIIAFLVQPVCSKPDAYSGKHLINDLQRSDLTCPGGPTTAVCQDFTPTTTTSTTTPASTAVLSTTTQTTTTGVPSPVIEMTIASYGATITISWTVLGDSSMLDKFEIDYFAFSDGNQVKIPIDKSIRYYKLENLKYGENYQICLQAIKNKQTIGVPQCKQQLISSVESTTKVATITKDENVGVIVGAAIGGVLAVVVIIAVIFILLKYRKTPPTKQPPAAAVAFTPAERPRLGYDSKRFSRQKNANQNGDNQIKIISDGKSDNARISAGSYQMISDKAVNNDPYPSKLEGANGTSRDLKPSKFAFSNNPHHAEPSPKSHYVNAPRAAEEKAPHYVNDIRGKPPQDQYANSVETRPLPKTPRNPLSDTSSGFLNHGFAPSPTDTEYHEIKFDSGTVV